MPNVYVQCGKINDVGGRSDYISNAERQEEIVLHRQAMKFDWAFYSAYEKSNKKSKKANNEARELIIALPNELEYDLQKLEKMCDELTSELVGKEHDYEYAVHWNHTRTNLHVHILFSEREVKSGEVEPKKYSRDIWMNKDTHVLAKPNSENAELVHRKGDVMLDKEGKPKYDLDVLSVKDKKFIPRGWIQEAHKTTQKVFLNNGFEIDVRDFDDPYLSQKKIYKNAREDYKNRALEWNEKVKEYNSELKEYLELSPAQESTFVKIKKEILENVRDVNRSSRSITQRAIDLVQEMVSKLIPIKAKVQISTHAIMSSWTKTKKQFDDLFSQNKELENEVRDLNLKTKTREEVGRQLEERIERKLELIREMEELDEQAIDR